MHDVVILGSGVAGLSAAMQSAQLGLNTLVIEGEGDDHWAGGQLVNAHRIENFPGFPDGVGGDEFIQRLRQHAVKAGAAFLTTDVVRVDFSAQSRAVWTEGSDNAIVGRTVIIATGAVTRWTHVQGEQDLRGYGVSSCATCDGAMFKNVPVVVVGDGDTALDDALYLAALASNVTVIHREQTLRAKKMLVDRAHAERKIQFLGGRTLQAVLADTGSPPRIRAAKVRIEATGTMEEIATEGVFIAIGQSPASRLFQEQLVVDANGYVATTAGSTRTSIDGVFACGEVADPVYRQAVTAAASGCMAAIDAARWLRAG